MRDFKLPRDVVEASAVVRKLCGVGWQQKANGDLKKKTVSVAQLNVLNTSVIKKLISSLICFFGISVCWNNPH